MSDKRNQATLTIMNQKNVLIHTLIEETESKIKKFALSGNNEYQKIIRLLIKEVKQSIKYSQW